MSARPTRWILSATLLLLVASVALANLVTPLTLVNGPPPRGLVGAPLTWTLIGAGGVPFVFPSPPYTYSISLGAGQQCPPGLNLDANSGAVTGTPTTPGVFTFSAVVTDSALVADPNSPPNGPDGQAAVRRRGLALGGNHTDNFLQVYALTVDPAGSVTGVPSSPWTLAMVMAGLAGAGFWRLRRTRRA